MLDEALLDGLSDEDLAALRARMTSSGFDAVTLLALSGKDVLRYINISPREVDFLRRQVLHARPVLLLLVDLFLLFRSVDYDSAVDILSQDLVGKLTATGILKMEASNQLRARACLTPTRDCHFLNEGEAFEDEPEHVLKLVLEQPYLIGAVELAAQGLLRASRGRILDLCSGSGVIGQALAPDGWGVVGVDINRRALSYARFNARLNRRPETEYILGDATKYDSAESFDLVVSNPPYNAYVPSEGTDAKNITLHAGDYGDEVCGAVITSADRLLRPGGVFAMCGITLLRDGRLPYAAAESMAANGTLILVHKPVSDVRSWEGLRLLFSATPDFEKVGAGELERILAAQNYFNQVTWALTIYVKGGPPGYHCLYNLPTDGLLFSPAVVDEFRRLTRAR